MAVRKRLELTGPGTVFITATVRNHERAFEHSSVVRVVVDQFGQALAHFRIRLIAYVFMPSHLHAVIGLRDLRLLSKFVQSFKILSAKRVSGLDHAEFVTRFRHRDGFAFWQPRFDQQVIVSEEQFKIKVEYIHNNPVKAGLVENSTDWLLSSASEWVGIRSGVLPISRDFDWV